MCLQKHVGHRCKSQRVGYSFDLCRDLHVLCTRLFFRVWSNRAVHHTVNRGVFVLMALLCDAHWVCDVILSMAELRRRLHNVK